MISLDYVWFTWASAFLLPWAVLHLTFPAHRHAMLWSSLFTMPFGLSEPLFVPEYWDPPSLFDLARTTGFDIESLIFCFGIGGTSAVLYNAFLGGRFVSVVATERHRRRHRFHGFALAAPFLAFPLLYLFPWNPIYPAIIAMIIGAVATILCRPDLLTKTWMGGALFLPYYAVFLWGLDWIAPGYIDQVWHLDRLSGIVLLGLPLEELLFAAGFGMYWAGVYEHFTWRTSVVGPGQENGH